MLHGSWRGLAPGGLFFCRLASAIGMEDRVEWISDGCYRLPDESERFLVDESIRSAAFSCERSLPHRLTSRRRRPHRGFRPPNWTLVALARAEVGGVK